MAREASSTALKVGRVGSFFLFDAFSSFESVWMAPGV